MKNVFSLFFVAVASMSLMACGGGGGGSTSTGGTYFTHEQLAQEFVNRVNVDVSGYDLQLVKTNTLQYDYIVVYDWDYGTYDAYYIGSYSPGQNLSSYLYNYSSYFYYNLTPESGNTYRSAGGILFEKVQPSSKNLAKMKALKQDLAINKTAEGLSTQYGMSAEKATDIARFALKLKTAAPGTYNKRDYDAFAKELTGSSISEFQTDIQSGNSTSLHARIEKAGEVSGMGSEGVNKLVKDVFTSN